jgi:hypothetical protein
MAAVQRKVDPREPREKMSEFMAKSVTGERVGLLPA